MDLKLLPIAVILFSLTIVAFFTAAYDSGNGFWSQYGYTPPVDNLDSFNKIADTQTKTEEIYCDITRGESQETCAGRARSSNSNPISDMVRGGYGALMTFISLFTIPKQLITDTLSELGVPAVFITSFMLIVLIVILIAVLSLIFNRSDSA